MDKTPWDAFRFFEGLTQTNRLARSYGFICTRCSGLAGFLDALAIAGHAPNVICVDDSSDGFADLDNTPSVSRVRTIFISMAHKAGNMDARQTCLEIERELFRQFMSALIPERTRIRQNMIYIDHRVNLSETDRYLHTGAAISYFQISVGKFTDLRYNPDEWI